MQALTCETKLIASSYTKVITLRHLKWPSRSAWGVFICRVTALHLHFLISSFYHCALFWSLLWPQDVSPPTNNSAQRTSWSGGDQIGIRSNSIGRNNKYRKASCLAGEVTIVKFDVLATAEGNNGDEFACSLSDR